MYDYSGAKDWERFSIYSVHVRNIIVRDDVAEIIVAEEWMSQLMSLPGRPNPLFPGLRGVELGNIDKPFHHRLLFIIGESLLHLGVHTRHNPSVLLAALPIIAHKCCDLTTFNYVGPSSPELFLYMSKILSLKNVFLSLTSYSQQKDIIPLRNLERLERLVFDMENSVGIVCDPDVPVHANAKPLQELAVSGSYLTQLAVQRAILPSPRQLDLTLTGHYDALSAIYGILRHCFSLSSRLTSVDIGFVGQTNEDMAPVDYRVTGATKQALVEGGKVLQQLRMVNVPTWVGEPISLVLQLAIPRWRSLEKLIFHVRTDQGLTGRYGRPYPNLSFLATIQQACPCIAEFDFHFDCDAWQFEPLVPSVQSSFTHPLRILRINTTRRDIALGVAEASHIAMYLDLLFPLLEEVSGSAQALWRDVSMLVQSYQAVRARISRAPGRA